MFSAETFKAAAVTQANADRYSPVPEGEYVGTIQSADVKAGESARGPWARYDVTVEVTDPTTDRSRNVRGGIMLDLNDDGELMFGPNRNVKLGQLRTATGTNQAGKPFNWDDVVGKEVKVLVKHRADKDDASKLYEDIVAWKTAY